MSTNPAAAAAKPIWASKTIWVNIITFICTMAALFGFDLEISAEEKAAIAVSFQTFANLILRLATKQPVTLRRDQTLKLHWLSPVVVLVLLLFTLAGCASRVAETPAQRVYALQADYNALLAAAVAYENLPRCRPVHAPPNCSDTGVVEEMRRIDNHTFDALQTAQRVVRTPGIGTSPVNAALATASEAVGLLARLLNREGIR